MSTVETFFSRLNAVAKLIHSDLDPEVMALYGQILEPIGWDRLVAAIDKLAPDLSPGKPFPSMRAIREAATGERAGAVFGGPSSDESEARTAAGLIVGAVSKFGSPISAANVPKLRAYVGELGWSVIQARGGWSMVCGSCATFESLQYIERDLAAFARAAIERRRLGIDTPPGLPEGPRGPGSLTGADMMAVLPEHVRARLAGRTGPETDGGAS